MSKRIIVSLSSDIGLALGSYWHSQGHSVAGTYRTHSVALDELARRGILTVQCDLSDKTTIASASEVLSSQFTGWDVLVLAPGSQDPVGPFLGGRFDEWEASVSTNFVAQLRFVHALLPFRARSVNLEPTVIFFAGGGVNNATTNYSAYTISKVALIKMCELLDAEIPDTCFTILGPGWVKTKIHNSTIKAQSLAGANYEKTLEKLTGTDCVPIERVVDCCDWLVSASRELAGGRNFSLVFDRWGSGDLEDMLKKDPNMYKLRRAGNDQLVAPLSAPTNSQITNGNNS